MPGGTAFDQYVRGAWAYLGQVDPAGYAWRDTADGPYLVTRRSRHGDGLEEFVALVPILREEFPIHRELAEVYRAYANSPTVEEAHARARAAIVQFAGSYGFLGCRSRLPEDPEDPRPVDGEPYETWLDAARQLGRIVELWDAVHRQDAVRLGQLLTWQPTRAAPIAIIATWGTKFDEVERLLVATADDFIPVNPVWFRRWTHRDTSLVEIGRCAVAHAFSLAFKGLHKLPGFTGVATLTVVESPDEAAPSGLAGYMEPMSLLAAAYVHLFWEITGERAYKPCEAPGCGRWLDATHRADRRYCDAACRKRAERARRKAAADAQKA